MSRLNLSNTAQTEERKCVYLLPTRIVKTFGTVQNEQSLLRAKKYYQVNLNDPDTAVFTNNGGERAGILLDMGREIHGGVRILCSKAAGGCANVLLRFGESASEALTPLGEKNTTNDHAVREFSVPVPFMSDQSWGETGYRFVYIELLSDNTSLSLKSVLGVFTYRDLEYKGAFRCSDELLNRIFDVSAYTCHLCLQNYLWDGIKRDRLVWIGDSHPEMLTVQPMFGRLKIFEDSIDEARDAYPLPDWINTMPSYSLWWMIIVHDQYFYNGDKEYLRNNREYLEGITEQVADCVDSNGVLELPSYFIDWPNRGTPAEKEGVKALCVIALNYAAELLQRIGNGALAEKASAAVARLKSAGADCSGSKSTQALAWFAGFADDKATADVLSDGGAKGVSTFFSYYILSALFGSGKKTEALDILREYYGGMLKMGATSFWEDFSVDWLENSCPIDRLPEPGENDIHGDFGAFCYKNFRHSLCHGWSSGPVAFLLKNILGISVDNSDGTMKIRVEPDLCGLDFAEGSYALPDGSVLNVRAEMTADGVKAKYSIDSNRTERMIP